MVFISGLSFAQVDANPNKQGMQYDYKGEIIDEATSLEEVVYDRNAIPVNCPAKKYRKLKKQQDLAKRKYYGTRWVDRTGDSLASLGKGVGKVAVYIVSGLIVTVVIEAILNKTINS
tara:strand:+ start:1163 stop:1513 length:351 start_codon:yes stop_codon:yes gene_type:complete